MRRGWSPVPASKGLVFIGVSLVTIATALTGTVLLLSSPESKHVPPTVATTTITSAELPSNIASGRDGEVEAAAMKTITPNDLPEATPAPPKPSSSPAPLRHPPRRRLLPGTRQLRPAPRTPGAPTDTRAYR